MPIKLPFVSRSGAKKKLDIALIKLGKDCSDKPDGLLMKVNIQKKMLISVSRKKQTDVGRSDQLVWLLMTRLSMNSHFSRQLVSSQIIQFLINNKFNYTIIMTGWGAIDETGDQSQFPRQITLPYNFSTNANKSTRYFLETNVGPDGEDTCEGDSGWFISNFLPYFNSHIAITVSKSYSKLDLYLTSQRQQS